MVEDNFKKKTFLRKNKNKKHSYLILLKYKFYLKVK